MGCRQDVAEREREREGGKGGGEETRSLIRNGVFSGNGTSIDRDRIAVAGRRVNATTTSIIGIAEISTSGCFEENDYTIDCLADTFMSRIFFTLLFTVLRHFLCCYLITASCKF